MTTPYCDLSRMSDIDRDILKNHDPGVRGRAFIELTIVRRVYRALRAAGYLVGIDEDEAGTPTWFPHETEALKVAFSTDECFMYAKKLGRKWGWVRFVFGNDGPDVINDYTVDLNHLMEPIEDWVNKEYDL